MSRLIPGLKSPDRQRSGLFTWRHGSPEGFFDLSRLARQDRPPGSGVWGLKVFTAIFAVLALNGGPSSRALAQGTVTTDPYTLCSFYPQGAPCEAVYQQALKNDSLPAARSVRDAFNFYARYLKTPGALTDQDRAWLQSSGIRLPADLTEANLGGLHNVINDPALANDGAARSNAVNNFISRAVEAEIFCGLNKCGNAAGA
jgi:hypothetical protein